eukprot:2661024-Pleurochrysis_carterae.AAC.12
MTAMAAEGGIAAKHAHLQSGALEECWDPDPAKRPTFAQLIPRLEGMLATLGSQRSTATASGESTKQSKEPAAKSAPPKQNCTDNIPANVATASEPKKIDKRAPAALGDHGVRVWTMHYDPGAESFHALCVRSRRNRCLASASKGPSGQPVAELSRQRSYNTSLH